MIEIKSRALSLMVKQQTHNLLIGSSNLSGPTSILRVREVVISGVS